VAGKQEAFNALGTLAADHGLRCTAVAIESLEQWQACTRHGCARAQGFFVAPGLSIAELGHWLSEWAQPAAPVPADGT